MLEILHFGSFGYERYSGSLQLSWGAKKPRWPGVLYPSIHLSTVTLESLATICSS